ncbi:MAG: hypothetical protein L0K70_00735, partial [Bifidobacterium crudilactis]|nr:hypothetical protein [Bifidobacterium crudilactis]
IPRIGAPDSRCPDRSGIGASDYPGFPGADPPRGSPRRPPRATSAGPQDHGTENARANTATDETARTETAPSSDRRTGRSGGSAGDHSRGFSTIS